MEETEHCSIANLKIGRQASLVYQTAQNKCKIFNFFFPQSDLSINFKK